MAEVVFLRSRDYRDLSLSFGLNPVTQDVIAVTGADAVKRSIRTLLSIIAGEVPFFPEFGSHISKLLFEPIDAFTTALLTNEIRGLIGGYEPRAAILSLDVTPSIDELRYDINIVFRLLNNNQPVTFSLFLLRLR